MLERPIPTPGPNSLIASIVYLAIKDLKSPKNREDARQFLLGEDAPVIVQYLSIKESTYQKWIENEQIRSL